jgi:hypothetical protein
MIGRVVSMRPVAPGVIVVPGNKPDRFVFSSAKVANVELGCLVTFSPLPPREPEHDCGQAVDVQFALPASEVPCDDTKKKPQPTKVSPDRVAGRTAVKTARSQRATAKSIRKVSF